ncbi:hypothetical protein ANN_06388 [Periplaneta americana]|uniref:Uncharacterized protein n=1 Tax=Periplaneta americana TaxID=6978 RepID=A0ABQ8TF84_PERAM|nr:hypothetical protein ANN_06388 [Periplaneta americana]
MDWIHFAQERNRWRVYVMAEYGRSEEKRIEAFEMWIWRRMERVKWTERVRNEAVLERVGEERMMLELMK